MVEYRHAWEVDGGGSPVRVISAAFCNVRCDPRRGVTDHRSARVRRELHTSYGGLIIGTYYTSMRLSINIG